MAKSEPKHHINERLHTEFANSGRVAGMGISYDRYDEESSCKLRPRDRGAVRFPSDGIPQEDLCGAVRVYRKEE